VEISVTKNYTETETDPKNVNYAGSRAPLSR